MQRKTKPPAPPEFESSELDDASPTALRTYVEVVRRYALLSRVDEHAIGVRAFGGDQRARDLLVLHNLRLGLKFAHVYCRQQHPRFGDLVQQANLGLIEAAKRYDPHRGVKFSTFASWWIRAFILRFLIENHHLIRFGTTALARHMFFNLRAVVDRITHDRGERGQATNTDLAKHFGLPEEEMATLRALISRKETSLDHPVASEDATRSSPLHTFLPAPEPLPDQILAAREAAASVRRALASLRADITNLREQAIIDRWYSGDTKSDVA